MKKKKSIVALSFVNIITNLIYLLYYRSVTKDIFFFKLNFVVNRSIGHNAYLQHGGIKVLNKIGAICEKH